MRILIVALALSFLGCADMPAQQGDLCPGEAPGASSAVADDSPRAVWLDPDGGEHFVAVEKIGPDGRATLIEFQRATRIEGAPCLVLPVPSLIRRPRETWGYPSADLLDSGAAVVFDDAAIVAGTSSPVKLTSAPIVQLAPGAWAPDPTGPMSADFAAAFNAACLEAP